MNARTSRLLRRMTKAKYGNAAYRHAKDVYAAQPHNAKSIRNAVMAAALEGEARRGS